MEELIGLKAPVVSIVIPVRNGQKKLHGCLKSIFSNEESLFEVIVVDDASSDCPSEICRGIWM